MADLILKISNKNFHLSLSRGAKLFHVDGRTRVRTDRRTDASWNAAKAFK
jgi:hypothetical protein